MIGIIERRHHLSDIDHFQSSMKTSPSTEKYYLIWKLVRVGNRESTGEALGNMFP